MIAVPAGMRVLVATRLIDFRKGADGLVALVSETLGNDPFSGTVFVFRSKRTDVDFRLIGFSFPHAPLKFWPQRAQPWLRFAAGDLREQAEESPLAFTVNSPI